MFVKLVIQQQVPNIITKMQLLNTEQAKLQHNIKQKGEEEFSYLFQQYFKFFWVLTATTSYRLNHNAYCNFRGTIFQEIFDTQASILFTASSNWVEGRYLFLRYIII